MQTSVNLPGYSYVQPKQLLIFWDTQILPVISQKICMKLFCLKNLYKKIYIAAPAPLVL